MSDFVSGLADHDLRALREALEREPIAPLLLGVVLVEMAERWFQQPSSPDGPTAWSTEEVTHG